jgi:hypothetical protein
VGFKAGANAATSDFTTTTPALYIERFFMVAENIFVMKMR